MSIFKAYDVRGIYPEEINENIVKKIVSHYALMRQNELSESRQLSVVIGRDMRMSSPKLFAIAKEALVAYGAKVIDVGLVSTPAFYFAVSFYNYDAGIMVSASHNPAEFNGLKLVRNRALPFGQGMGMEELAEAVNQNQEVLPSSFTGEIEEKNNINEEFVKFESKETELGKLKKFKIVTDTANGMGATYLEELIKLTPNIEWVRMNFELDGSFPAHPADPLKMENTIDLRKKVLEEKADLGVAIDGDGDRLFLIDDKGEFVEPGILRGFLSKLFLRDHPGAIICYDIRPGKITPDVILENGGKPSLTRVGHSLIKQQMVAEDAVFGGESSGHFFVKFPHGVYEAPVLVLLKILKELSDLDMSLSDYIKPFKKYFSSGEINFKVQDAGEVLKRIAEKYSDGEKNELDGLSITYPDVWFNVRASNTEPVIRLNVEGTTRNKVEDLVKEISLLIV